MTNELIKVQTTEQGEQRVSARELHKELGVKTRFSLWKEQNFKMFVEGIDFKGVVVTTPYREGSNKLQTLQDYSLTTDMAKNVAMMSKTPKSQEIRNYFIEVEKQHKTMLQQQQNVPMDPMSQIQMLASSTYKALEEVQTDMAKLKSLFGLPEDLAADLNSAINSKITYILGGKKSHAYESMSKKAFPAFYRNLRDYFHVTSYKKIPVERFQEAMNYVNNWTPDTNLRLEINRVNAQMSLEV